MINANEPCLRARERGSRYNGGETILQHYIKSKRGYFLNAFFGGFFWKCFAFCLVAALFLLLQRLYFRDFTLFRYIMLGFLAFGAFAWLVSVCVHLWFWKYSRHVIVTDKGIWIMIYSTFWWSKAFDEKKHFLSACWSFYEWEELNGVFSADSRVSRACKLKDLVIDRWDGETEVRYLKSEEIARIEEYAKTYIPAKKRKKQRDFKRKFSLHDIFH